jgi:hypothetical protein
MPYQLGETIIVPVQFNHIDTGVPFVPTGTPTITIVAPDGTGSPVAATQLATTTLFRRSFVPTTAGQYYFYGNTADADASRTQTETEYIEVGQTWITRIDAAISTRATPAQITAILTSGEVTFLPVVDPTDGNINIWRDDDYTVLSGRTLPAWESDSWLPYDLSNAQWIRLMVSNKYAHEEVIGTTVAVSDTEIETRITKAEKEGLSTGINVYEFKIRAKLDVLHGEAEETLVWGYMTVMD